MGKQTIQCLCPVPQRAVLVKDPPYLLRECLPTRSFTASPTLFQVHFFFHHIFVGPCML